MLVPAILYKSEIEKSFAKKLYSNDFFLYTGDAHYNVLPEINTEKNLYQYAIINKDKLIGYFAYSVNPSLDCVNNFGLISFSKGNYIIGRDILGKLENLIKYHHRVEWFMVGNNPAKKHYDKLCLKYGGNIIKLQDVVKDPDGNYLDGYIYEIVNSKR